MPWTTKTLKQLRANNRDYIAGALPGADATIPNSNLRVVADSNAGLAHLNLQFLAWLALQLLPTTNETEWLDRWANMYLVNADGSKGRKQASYAGGTITVGTLGGLPGIIIPAGAQLVAGNGTVYQTTAKVTIGAGGTAVATVIALAAGIAGNLDAGATMRLSTAITSLNPTATAIQIDGGTDIESADDLRIRVLERLANPPMGGDAQDYVAWTQAVPGVTRAWSAPNEMGIGTITVRFMMDDLRASNGGFPTADDVNAVAAYLNSVRPVTVKDFFVVAPIPEPVNFTISNLDPDNASTWADIVASVNAMLMAKARPAYAKDGVLQAAQTIYAAWVSEAVLQAAGVVSFDLAMDDHVMPNNGCLAVLGSVNHG